MTDNYAVLSIFNRNKFNLIHNLVHNGQGDYFKLLSESG